MQHLVVLFLCLFTLQCRAWLTVTTHRSLLGRRFTSNVPKATKDQESSSELPEILFYNSRSRTKEPLKPISSPKVSMYTCGPTVSEFATPAGGTIYMD